MNVPTEEKKGKKERGDRPAKVEGKQRSDENRSLYEISTLFLIYAFRKSLYNFIYITFEKNC